MSCRSVARAAAAAFSFAAASPAAARAQPSASLDATVSSITFDDYLRSGVASLAPSARLEAGALSLETRGAISRFESGRMSAQGVAGARWLTPVRGALRGELRASGGVSWYDNLSPWLNDLQGEARLHATMAGRGVWVSDGRGRVVGALATVRIARAGAGAWTQAGPGSVAISLVRTSTGRARYTDREAQARWPRGRLELAGVAGARRGATGSGATRWLALSAAWRLTTHASLVAAAGRYPPDAAEGTPGAEYATLGLRFTLRERAPRGGRSLLVGTGGLAPLRSGLADETPRPEAGRFVVRSLPGGVTTLEIAMPGARLVEVMGDFTEWSSVPLARDADGVWRLRALLAPGTHRVNIRIDGGEWRVPDGLASVGDDFGGAAGLLLVP